MSQGQEHVAAALELIEGASGAIGTLGGGEADWRAAAVARLASTTTLLRAVMDRFFLKTRLCLPFASKCEEEAAKLDALVAELGAELTPDGRTRLDAALTALERAAKTLDERSLMQGMAIT
jgi:hypothetical protein